PTPTSTANDGGLSGDRDADEKAERATALHPRAPPGGGGAAVVRRNETSARAALEIRNSPAHHGARGARLHSPARKSRPGHRSLAAARIGDGLNPKGSAILAKRHPGQSRARSASRADARSRRSPGGDGPDEGRDRGRHHDLGHPDAAA